MAGRKGRRQFGWVRQLASGRWQASYLAPTGRRLTAPKTFVRKQDGGRWLSLVEADIARGVWRDPVAAEVALGDYAETWIAERPGLRPRTVELYQWLQKRYIEPHLGRLTLAELDNNAPAVRTWRQQLLDAGVSATMVAKAYRLLRAIPNTAVEDDTIRRNPCRIKGADAEQAAERPTLTPAQVATLAASMPARFVPLVMLATYASLRWGEVTALRRMDVDLEAATVRVERAHVELSTGEVLVGPPKSRAGKRTVSFPPALVPLVRRHLSEFVGAEPAALLFAGPKGALLRRSNFNKLTSWPDLVAAVGAPGLRIHDLRHTGNTLASKVPGTTIRDLMLRMGHDNTRAAMIYLHTTQGADRAIAEALPVEMSDEDDPDDGAAGALVPAGR